MFLQVIDMVIIILRRFNLKKEYKDVHYLLSSDIEKIEDDSISYLKDNIVCFDSNIEVSTYLSNDEGIAFMVKVMVILFTMQETSITGTGLGKIKSGWIGKRTFIMQN